MTRILLFDVDMTLITTGGAGRKAMDAVFEEAFGVDGPTEGVRFDGRTDHAIFMEVIALHRLAAEDLVEVYERMTAQYLKRLETTIGTTSGQILPGVEALLDALEGTGAVAGLATGNLRRGAEIKLGRYGLWGRFVDGGFGDDTPVRAEVVHQGMLNVAKAAGVEADARECIVIGDTPLDVEAARLTGMRCLGVATGRYGVEELLESGADWAVVDLSETEALCALLAVR